MKKFLFFDIDGVLNTNPRKVEHPTYPLWQFYPYIDDDRPYPLTEFFPYQVKKLNQIIEFGKVTDLVCISDWRFTEGIENILRKAGVKIDDVQFSITPCLPEVLYEERRAYEIIRFLDNEYDVFTFYILDDIDFYSNTELKHHFTKIDEKYGIRNRDFRYAIEHLKYGRCNIDVDK